MLTMLVAGIADGASLAAAPGMELGRGAIAGAFIVAGAFLAGYAAIRRSGLAVCALLMVAAAAALQFSWLGFLPAISSDMTVMLLALFAAAAIVFLSASVGAARHNALLGGVMFTAALVIGGMGLINFFDRVDLAPLMRWSVIGVGAMAAILALTQAFRGDMGARLILPGVAIAAAAPLVGPLGGLDAAGFSLAPHGLFTLGILAASLVALTEGAAPRLGKSAAAFNDPAQHFASQEPAHHHHASFDGGNSRQREEIVLDSQIARVLDYSGVAIWDWAPDKIDQTESLPTLLGADSTAPFTPEALRNFIHKEDAARFEEEVLTPVDGPFDVALKLYDGRLMRLRGARAANDQGELERLVAFVETASPKFTPSKDSGVDGAVIQKATEAAIVPAAASTAAAKLSDALENGDIVAAFQPIVALDDKKIAGYEALARWRDQEGGADEGPETFVKAAESAGKGDALALTILQQAVSYLADKMKTEKRDDLFVAMNVSWTQMRSEAFAKAVSDAIKKYKLPKSALVLELTEGDAVSDRDNASKVFQSFKNAGAALAFDDFGAGFTCLSNLRQYDFDYLKIDKSFASDLENGGDGAKIVASLAELGKGLGLKVIVEGVESGKAADAALDLGCGYGQGYALGKPFETKRAAKAKPVDKGKVLKKLSGDFVDNKPAKDEEAEVSVEMADAKAEKKTGRWKLWRGGDLR